jgi:ubiquinone/menaquinone biosynthesis C-methylase UbiE
MRFKAVEADLLNCTAVNFRVRVLLALGEAIRRFVRFAEPCDLAPASHDDAYFQYELDLGRRFLSRVPPVAGRRVLELGCGFGGMLAVLNDAGATATGIDIDERRASFARTRQLDGVTADAASLPLPDKSFDVVVTDATLEHVNDLPAVLAESFRVLRPGGKFYGSWGPAWLSYNGPHLIKCLAVPWVHLLFSDETIVAALEEQKRRGRWPVSYLDYKIADFQSMGRTTRRKLRLAVRAAGFDLVEETSTSPRHWKDVLSHLPLLDELLAGGLFVVLRKPYADYHRFPSPSGPTLVVGAVSNEGSGSS